jgi:hypothetical protein
MSKTKIQQLVVIILLIVFGVIWGLSRKTASTPTAVISMPLPSSYSETLPAPSAEEQREPEEMSLARDPFALPSPLLNMILEKKEEEEEQRRQKSQKDLSQQQRPVPSAEWRPETAASSSFQLQGLFWNIATPQAIINRKTVSVGDSIENGKVASISKEGVILSLDGREVLLKPERSASTERDRNEWGGRMY